MTATGRLYLDHNATTPVRPEVAEAMARALALPGNPSSVHAEGREARKALEQARSQVAALLGARPEAVIFASGGSEANATALAPGFADCDGTASCSRDPAELLLFSATEHACVRDGHRFPADRAEAIPVDADGLVDLAWIEDRLARLRAERPGARALVSVHLANNETGVLQPLREIAAIVHRHGGLLHADAVQAAGKIAIDMGDLGADVVAVSAHKCGGPKGVGAIVLRTPALDLADKLVRGGGQERGWRAGTENLPGIVGFGAAAAIAARDLASEGERLTGLRARLESGIKGLRGDLVIFGERAARLPNTTAFAAPGMKAETALIRYDLAGIALSSGSACSSGKVRRSHVLTAMGVDPAMSEGALRASLGWTTSEADIDRFLAVSAQVLAAPSGAAKAAA